MNIFFRFVSYGLIVFALIALSACAEHNSEIRPYLILYAFDAEGELLAGKINSPDSVKILGRMVYSGQLSGQDIVLAESGIGMTNAAMTTQKLIDHFNPRGIIFTGIAGAIDSSVLIGDIVACREWIMHDYGYHGQDGFKHRGIAVYDPSSDSIFRVERFDVDSTYYDMAEKLTGHDFTFGIIGEREPRFIIGAVGVSGDCFIDNHEKRIWLSENFEALVTDMESASVAQVCRVNGLPFIVFRSASDLAGGSGSESARTEMNQFFQIAADNSSQVVLEFLNKL
ncbi:MAG: 5'-methylthioadenosine/S-adenosylhomocysteine nucleosidase [FCB group bacterium]|nr:5'-methylthioadenosine/S-adenosylhomocysteine nucleosidase [FCB group bacterium]